MLSTANYKGTRDFYPEDLAKRNYIFKTWRSVTEAYGFSEYETSLLEDKAIYTAKSGEELANTQLYWFTDKGDREVALRPEQTPSLARMVAAKHGELAFPLKWFTIPNCFRYERPQKGRLREFWQLNVDIIGAGGWQSDTELLVLIHRLFQAFNAPSDSYRISLNHRGVLDEWISIKGLADKKEEIYKLLDSWHKLEQTKKSEWLKELNIDFDFDSLFNKEGEEYGEYVKLLLANEEFAHTWKHLHTLSAETFVIDPGIVRGIAYYTGTVFEAYDNHPENPRALFGGGRYDQLLELFGKSAPAVGFGWGDVTMHEFLEGHGLYPDLSLKFDVGILVEKVDSLAEAFETQKKLITEGKTVYLDTEFNRSENKRRQALEKRVKEVVVIGL